jgi:acetyltransferase-like isoleucine patch superfamily enzyme
MYRLIQALYKLYRCASYPIAAVMALFFIVLGYLSDRVKGDISQPSLVISRIPFFVGERARWLYYRALLEAVGRDVTFKYGSFCQYRKARLGNRVLIGYFNTLGEVSIGNDVLVGGNVNFLSGLAQHGFHDPDRLIWDTPGKGRIRVNVGSDVWIGSNAVIGSDVGDRCVIATGSIVVKPIAAHSLAGGNPASILKRI